MPVVTELASPAARRARAASSRSAAGRAAAAGFVADGCVVDGANAVAPQWAEPVAAPARGLHAVPAAVPDLAPSARPVRPVRVDVLRAPVNAESAAPVRLTRRGVAVLSLAVAVLGIALVWLAARSAPSTAAGVPARAGGIVTVHSGDTLWSIASRVAPQVDPRAEVAALQQANHLRGADLVPGQRLRLP